jgi:transcriptional regulator with XRE-family HTH domain
MRENFGSIRDKLQRLKRKTFRNAYVRANTEQGIAHQIRIQRQAKGWSQRKLALRIGATRQSAVARLEDPSYGRHTLATLLKLASAFDVALLVKFVSYGRLLSETADLSPAALRAESFDIEYPKLTKLQDVATPTTQTGWSVMSGGPATILIDRSLSALPNSGLDILAIVKNGGPGNVSLGLPKNLTSTGASQWLQ